MLIIKPLFNVGGTQSDAVQSDDQILAAFQVIYEVTSADIAGFAILALRPCDLKMALNDAPRCIGVDSLCHARFCETHAGRTATVE
jgi:hypothetical protein